MECRSWEVAASVKIGKAAPFPDGGVMAAYPIEASWMTRAIGFEKTEETNEGTLVAWALEQWVAWLGPA